MMKKKIIRMLLAASILTIIAVPVFAGSSLELAQANGNTIVKIVILRAQQPTNPQVTGTGFFITNDGMLLTNFHVIDMKYRHEDGYNLVVQRFIDEINGYKLYFGEVIEVSPTLDLAIVKITSYKYDGEEYFEEGIKPVEEVFPAVTFHVGNRNSNDGIEVTTAGFPSIEMYRGFSEEEVLRANMLYSRGNIIGKQGQDIKVSCPSIYPGASGSPVFSDNGVIGIAHAMYNDGYTHFGLIIPMFRILDFIPDEIELSINMYNPDLEN